MLSSRERVNLALHHEEPDRVPLDLGGSPVTGMHVSTVYRLRQALRLDDPGTPVKVIEPYQVLGNRVAVIMVTGTENVSTIGFTPIPHGRRLYTPAARLWP